MINVTEEKEAYHDEERNHQVDRAARGEHRHSYSHSPRSNILLGLLDQRRCLTLKKVESKQRFSG